MKFIIIVILAISFFITGCSSKNDNRNSSIHNEKVSDKHVVSIKNEKIKDEKVIEEVVNNDEINETTDTSEKTTDNVPLTNKKNDKNIIIKNNIALSKDKSIIAVKSRYKGLDDIHKYFTYADAKNSAMLVLSGMKIITGQDVWNEFLDQVHKGDEASILIVRYYENIDGKQYNDKGTKQRKGDDFIKFIYQLDYDGKSYKLSHYEGNKRYAYSYPYMIEKIGMESNAAIASHGFYLVYNEKLTYHDLRWSLLSSNSSDHIDYQPVFEEKVDKVLYLSCSPGIYQTKDGNTSMYLDENCRFLFIKNKLSKNLPVGRYYFEDKKLILKTRNGKQYLFSIKGKGLLKYKSSKSKNKLVREGTEFIINKE